MKWNLHLPIAPAWFKARFSEAAQRAVAFALLHFVYGIYLGYSGDFDFNAHVSPSLSPILGIPAALTPALFLGAGAFLVTLVIGLAGQASAVHRHAFWAILIGAGIAGSLLGAFMLSMALDHNPQGAFYNETGIAYAALSAIFYSWFLALFLPITLAMLTLLLIFGRRQRRLEVARPADAHSALSTLPTRHQPQGSR